MQGVDLNMEPAVEESALPSDMVPIVCAPSTRDYQIALIESRGPNSGGVRMLRAGLANIGKTYDPQTITTTVPRIQLKSQVDDLNMSHLRHLPTREYQIALIESRGPYSRGVRLLHAGLADLGKNTHPQPGLTMDSLPMEAPQDHYHEDGQIFRL